MVSSIVRVRSNSMGYGLLLGDEDNRKDNHQHQEANPEKVFKRLQNEMREAALLNLLSKYLTKQ